MFSVIQDQQSRELSQGKKAKRAKQLKIEETELKLPPVTDLAACQVSLIQSLEKVIRDNQAAFFPCISI